MRKKGLCTRKTQTPHLYKGKAFVRELPMLPSAPAFLSQKANLKYENTKVRRHMLKEIIEQESLQTEPGDIDTFDDIDSPVTPLENPLDPQYKNHQAQALSAFLKTSGKRVTPIDFYSDVFPEGALADSSTREKGKYAGRIFRDGELSQYVNDDMAEIMKCTPDQSAEMNCIAYIGQGKSSKEAFELYAMIFRVLLPEEVRPWYVKSRLESMEFVPDRFGMPYPRTPRICPTYILTDPSFESVFFCYILKDPIPMYHHLHKKLQRLYDALSRAIHKLWDIGYWDDLQQRFTYTYECKKPMPESIFRRYPVVGSKLGDGECVAYKVGHKYDLDELNALVPKVSRVELYDPKMTLEEAKEKYADWHRRHIEQHRKPSGSRTFHVPPIVYSSFIEDVVMDNKDTVQLGVFEALAAYAVKANICEETFLLDMDFIHKVLLARFDETDILEHKNNAKEEFEENPLGLHYKKTEEIGEMIGIPIPPTKRNGRTQKEHLKLVHDSQSMESKVLAWVKDNPKGTKTQCSKELNISRKTVSKWWPSCKKREKTKKETSVKNPCPICGAEMVKTKVGPHFWEQKSKFYARIDKDCPNCKHHIKGKAYPCQRSG